MDVEDDRWGEATLLDATGVALDDRVPDGARWSEPEGDAPTRPGPTRGAVIVTFAQRRLRWLARQALLELAAAGPGGDAEQEAAASILALADAGDSQGLAEILRPDPDDDSGVIWTVACYQIGDLTPSALRDLSDPVEAVHQTVHCADASHLAAELVASNSAGLRWTAMIRAGARVRFHLPGQGAFVGAPDDGTGDEPGVEGRWHARLTRWSAEGEPAAAATGTWPSPRLVEDQRILSGSDLARRAIAAAAALAEGAGVELDASFLFRTTVTPARLDAQAPAPERPDLPGPVTAPLSDGGRVALLPELVTGAIANPSLEAARIVHGAEMEAATLRHAAEMDALATRHAAELEDAFRCGRDAAREELSAQSCAETTLAPVPTPALAAGHLPPTTIPVLVEILLAAAGGHARSAGAVRTLRDWLSTTARTTTSPTA